MTALGSRFIAKAPVSQMFYQNRGRQMEIDLRLKSETIRVATNAKNAILVNSLVVASFESAVGE